MNRDRAQEVEELVAALLANNRVRAQQVGERVTQDGGALGFMEDVVVPALERVGRDWEQGQVALSQVYVAGRICDELAHAALAQAPARLRTTPKVAAAVLEDHHGLGIRVVALVLRAAGYDVVEYSVGWTPEALAARAAADGIDVLLVSVLMLRSALRVKDLKAELVRLGARTRVGVGGAPFRLDRELWIKVHADGFGTHAADAVALVQQLGGTP